MEDAARLVGTVTALGKRGHVFYSDEVFRHRNGSLLAAKEAVKEVKDDMDGCKEKVLTLFNVEVQTLCTSSALESMVVTRVKKISCMPRSRSKDLFVREKRDVRHDAPDR